jgi:hypothetical protein
MRTRMVGIAVAALLAAVIVGPMKTYGTSYDPMPHGEGAELGAGATVFLFHSGTEEVRRSLAVGEVLEVTRPGENGASRTVGKIRVAAPAGAVCVRGEVLEGGIHLHDLAGREGVYCLVVPEAVCRR